MGPVDPIVLVCGAILLVGSIVLVWALKAYKRISGNSESQPKEEFALNANEWINTPPPPLAALPSTPAPPPEANKGIMVRLDEMGGRLAEMQNVLTRQIAAAAAPSGPSGGESRQPPRGGLPPETLEKLLEIIGNVNQQVDVLKQSFGGATPVAEPPGERKSIGVPGGALSSFPKKKEESEYRPFPGMRPRTPNPLDKPSAPPSGSSPRK